MAGSTLSSPKASHQRRLWPWIALSTFLCVAGACGFNKRTNPCWAGPCWRYLSPSELQARHYRHIVAITDWGFAGHARAPADVDLVYHDLRAGLARGFLDDSLRRSLPAGALQLDSSYHRAPNPLGAGEDPPQLPDSSWRTQWPNADAVLRVRALYVDPGDGRCRRADSCLIIDLHLWDVPTDSVVWGAEVDPYAVRPATSQTVLGPWIASSIVRILKRDEVLP